jgi:group II intron reverse transcriptase/maturase
MASLEGKMAGTPISDGISTRLQRIAELAREAPERAFLSLAHYIDIELLREAYRRTRKNGAPGIDGQTAEQYEANLEENLQSLLDRFKSGRYHAPPVLRVHIPKGDGSKTRPIGIPTFEDKVLQRAVAMVLGAVYEQDFLDCSYGFRPGRSAHQALNELWHEVMKMGGGWVYEVDIQSFFDELDHGHLRSFLDRRVRDGVLRRMIDKWLKAGVMEEGRQSYPESGTPQGGVISPLLANVYLHKVLDTWFEKEVRPRLKGRACLIRYADDVVMAFELEQDAARVVEALAKRLARFGLRLHPEKSRLVRFQRPPRGAQPSRQERPGTFDLLGFTHYWGMARNGSWALKRKTSKDRIRRSLKRVAEWCRLHRHYPRPWQHAQLSLKLRGYYDYYGISGNFEALKTFQQRLISIWKKWLNRRSQRKTVTWERFWDYIKRNPLPRPAIAHPAIP